MIDEQTVKRIRELCSKPVALGGWLGLPYEDEGCVKFAIRFYKEMGIELDYNRIREPKNFVDVTEPQFGDMAVFYDPAAKEPWHIGVMVDYRKMVQCAEATNGVGKIPIDILRPEFFRGYKRHKSLCS